MAMMGSAGIEAAMRDPGTGGAGGGQPAVPGKPCPACDGLGEVPADTDPQVLIMKMEQDMAAQVEAPPQGMPPTAQGVPQQQGPPPTQPPPVSPSATAGPDDRAGIQSYMQNRPPQFSGQSVNEDEAVRQSQRARDRMKSGGVLGRA